VNLASNSFIRKSEGQRERREHEAGCGTEHMNTMVVVSGGRSDSEAGPARHAIPIPKATRAAALLPSALIELLEIRTMMALGLEDGRPM
jgi:hypothetical protein